MSASRNNLRYQGSRLPDKDKVTNTLRLEGQGPPFIRPTNVLSADSSKTHPRTTLMGVPRAAEEAKLSVYPRSTLSGSVGAAEKAKPSKQSFLTCVGYLDFLIS